MIYLFNSFLFAISVLITTSWPTFDGKYASSHLGLISTFLSFKSLHLSLCHYHIVIQPDLERVSNKIRAAELASMTSVADAKRRFSEIDEVLVSMDGAEKIEAMLQVLNSQLKLQINEDSRSRSFVASN